MRRARTGRLAGAASVALVMTALATGNATAGNDQGRSLRAVGLTDDGKLVSFRTGNPRSVGKERAVTGFDADTRLVGIDYRVQDGLLYGVGDAGGVYTLTGNGTAVKVSQLTVPLDGTAFGVDFNPAADRLRVVSNTGQNLRHDVNPGGATIADTPLTAPPAAGTVAGITAAAYTNNDLSPATATSLFDLDTTLDQVALQSPANAGLLAATGKLGVDATGDAGFDIYSRQGDDVTRGNRGFATLSVGGKQRLYKISLLTGRADRIGTFPRDTQVVDLALRLDQ